MFIEDILNLESGVYPSTDENGDYIQVVRNKGFDIRKKAPIDSRSCYIKIYNERGELV